MKKLLSAVIALTMISALVACGSPVGGAEPSSNVQSPTAAPAETMIISQPETAPTPQPESAPTLQTESEPMDVTEQSQGGTLITYFSWSGNTAELAEMIQAETGGDLFEITTETPYTEDYDALLDQAQQEQRDNARPALSGQVDNWDSYSVIFVGYPNWWSDTPMAVLTFLESYDFTGKIVVPFCTHGSSGFGRSLSSVEASASGAIILEGFEVRGANVGSAQSDVASWISSLALGE